MVTDSTEQVPPQTQQWPGRTSEMEPLPDHGEESWTGRGRLQGRRALVTGGDSGIGRAIAIAFAKEGADVAITFLPDEVVDAEEVAEIVTNLGRRCVLLATDLRIEEASRQVVTDAVAGLGGLDALVCNAGFQMGVTGGVEEFTGDIPNITLDC